MSNIDFIRVIIRHNFGSKANQVEQIDITSRERISLGRDASNDVVYHQTIDDTVSRNHCAITITNRNPLTFKIEDLGSSNGTFLNKRKLENSSELLPDDVITLGQNGPSFIFDLQPRPAHLIARTRVMDVSGAATRIVAAGERGNTISAVADSALKSADLIGGVSRGNALNQEDKKRAIGHDTMLHAIETERGSNNKKWIGSITALLALGLLGGGALYFSQLNSSKNLKKEAELETQKVEKATQEETQRIKNKVGMTPADIAKQYSSATAKISARWRLFDEVTGRPIFLKTVELKNKSFPLYVKLRGGVIVPWLTLDDENRSNIPISGQIEGTAFSVSESGFLLTNKHIAAAWRLPFEQCAECLTEMAVLVEPTSNVEKPFKFTVMDLHSESFRSLKDWAPEQGGLIFAGNSPRIIGPGNIPDPRKNQQHSFVGRNENLTVTFPGNRLGLNASLVRYSNDSDAALIKVDSPEPITKVELSDQEIPAVGDRVTVMGFPGIAVGTYAMSETIETGKLKTNVELLPKPYISEGIVAMVSEKLKSANGMTVGGIQGNIFQLTINSTGAGNSGGPVFDSTGKVIGLFTYIFGDATTRNSAAVPIKYGIDLLK